MLRGRTPGRPRSPRRPSAIGELLCDLNSSGQTLILVTHNPDLAARYARRVIEIVDGRIASDACVSGASR
jgi:ABC-type lipoprotein export system ATPase subunit